MQALLVPLPLPVLLPQCLRVLVEGTRHLGPHPPPLAQNLHLHALLPRLAQHLERRAAYVAAPAELLLVAPAPLRQLQPGSNQRLLFEEHSQHQFVACLAGHTLVGTLGMNERLAQRWIGGRRVPP